MPAYQIHRLRESARLQFRNAPHTSGAAIVKQKDYEKGATLEASSPYAAWMALRDTSDALQVGDLLELESGELRIFKYIGFEEARWYVLEPSNAPDAQAIAVT
jgi:hypothetical protein